MFGEGDLPLINALAKSVGVGFDLVGDLDAKLVREEEVAFGEEVVVAHGGVFTL